MHAPPARDGVSVTTVPRRAAGDLAGFSPRRSSSVPLVHRTCRRFPHPDHRLAPRVRASDVRGADKLGELRPPWRPEPVARAVPVRRRRLRDRRHRPGNAGRSPRLHRAVASARIRLNQVATSVSGLPLCPADPLRGGWRAVASWLAGGGSRCVRSASVLASRRCRPAGPGLRRRCALGWWVRAAAGGPGSGSGCGGPFCLSGAGAVRSVAMP